MSGHSKWNSIKRQKAVTDAKRANAFTKLARNITVAAKQGGGDPEMNFTLRLAVDKAKAANMPKDNIERSIKRGTGELEGSIITEAVYEGFGPNQTQLIIVALTDNTNRALTDIKTIMNKNGGQPAGQNAVSWNFDKRGVIYIEKESLSEVDYEAFELAVIEAGAVDIINEEEGVTIYTEVPDLHSTIESLKKQSINPTETYIGYVPKEQKELSPEDEEKLLNLIELLEENDDVDRVFHNAA